MMSLVVYVSDDKMLRGLRDKALVIFVEDFMLHPKYEKIMQEINLNGLPKMYVKDPTKLLSNQEVH
jgi:ribosomal protein S17